MFFVILFDAKGHALVHWFKDQERATKFAEANKDIYEYVYVAGLITSHGKSGGLVA